MDEYKVKEKFKEVLQFVNRNFRNNLDKNNAKSAAKPTLYVIMSGRNYYWYGLAYCNQKLHYPIDIYEGEISKKKWDYIIIERNIESKTKRLNDALNNPKDFDLNYSVISSFYIRDKIIDIYRRLK